MPVAPPTRTGLRLGILALGAWLGPRVLRRWVEGPATLPADQPWPRWEPAAGPGSATPVRHRTRPGADAR